MKNTTIEQRRWRMCLGVVSALTLAGSLTVLFTPRASAQDAHQFNRVCRRCHGPGEDPGPETLTKNHHDEAGMRKVIREGTKHMKAIPPTKLSDAQLDEVIAYLRSTHAIP